jgi:hypothetical protein
VPEIFRREVAELMANINDCNTNYATKRKITLEFVFEPFKDRAASRCMTPIWMPPTNRVSRYEPRTHRSTTRQRGSGHCHGPWPGGDGRRLDLPHGPVVAVGDAMTSRQLEILQHTLGVDQYGRIPRGFTDYTRNHFCAGLADERTCRELIAIGLMQQHATTSWLPYFNCSATDAGKAMVHLESPAPPKLTRSQKRYRDYLDAERVGYQLSTKTLHELDMRPPQPSAMELETLSGFVDAIEHGAYPASYTLADLVVQVDTPGSVFLRSKKVDEYGRRAVLAWAKLPKLAAFPFGEFVGHESFYISVMSLFASYQDDRDYVLKMATSVSSGQTITTSDDGITQQAVIQSGAALKSETTLKARVNLSPFRTFREATQPTSEYVFRVKQGDKGVNLALFESDGGAWRITAMQNIKTWLTNALKAQGAGDVPVIA